MTASTSVPESRSPGPTDGAMKNGVGSGGPSTPAARPSEPKYRTYLRKVVATARVHWCLVTGLVAAVAYTAGVGWILSERYWAFQTYAWDLGGFNQGMWTTTFAGRLFYYTADLPSGNPGSLMASHFSPFLFLLLPFYAIAPTPAGLLVLQEAGLAAGAVPLYLLARRVGLPDVWTLLVLASYLASPVLMGIGWYDFHAEAFLPATVLLAVYCYYYSTRWAFLASWLMCLSVIETVAPLLFLFAAASFVALVYDRYKGVPRPRESWLRATVAMAAVPAWLGLALLFNWVAFRTVLGTLGTSYSSVYSTLGPNLSFIAVVPYALLHPAAAGAALQADGFEKLAYILVLFGSLAFLPFLGPKRLLLPALGWLLLVVLSNGGSLAEFGNQTAAYGFSFLVAGLPFGVARLRRLWLSRSPAISESSSAASPRRTRLRSWRPAARPATGFSLVMGVVVTGLLISPLQAAPALSYPGVAYGIPTVNQHDEVLHQVIGLIPSQAGVLTVSAVFPEVSSRVHAYVNPISTAYRPNVTYIQALDGYVNESQFVLLDFQIGFFDSSFMIKYADLSGFGVFAEEDQIILFERGWTGPPKVWVPYVETWCGDQFGTTQYSYLTSTNVSGCNGALSSVISPPRNTLLWFGPYVYGLPPGRYAVTYWVSVNAQLTDGQIWLYTLSYPLVLLIVQNGATDEHHTYGFELNPSGNQSLLNSTIVQNPGPGPRTIEDNFTLDFDWGNLADWGVAGWTFGNGTQAHLYQVSLRQLSF